MILPDPSIALEPGNKVVVFVHHLREGLTAEQLSQYKDMDGYLGHECANSTDGTVFMSYWRDDKAVSGWARNPLHRHAKAQGKAEWYASYRTVICTVERHGLSTP
jgi:heme-degrading monooxygenase HmoA